MTSLTTLPTLADLGGTVAHHRLPDGEQLEVTFPNGRGASVVRHSGSYGGRSGLWELAVLDRGGQLDFTTPIGSDVHGWLNEAEVVALLVRIAALDA